MKKLPISEASDEQLRDYAALTLQLEAAFDAKSRPELEALIQTAWPNDWIMVDEPDGASEQTMKVAPTVVQDFVANNAGYENDPVVLLKIRETDMPGGKEPVPVGCNGRTVVIQRNQLARVPWRFYLILKDSTHGVVSQDEKTKEITETHVPRFPLELEVTALPSREEIDAWFERTKDLVA